MLCATVLSKYLTGQGAHRDDSSFFFAAETPAKKNAHALPSGLEALRAGSGARPDKFRQLTRSVRSFPFLPSSALWNVYPVESVSYSTGADLT